jgi:hyaluronan synthase
MPAAVLASWTILRAMRWYGMATCARTGWGTRQHGAEVALNTPPAADLPDDDTLRIPRLPLTKLYNPDTEITLHTVLRTR